jgi:hypothetical protein
MAAKPAQLSADFCAKVLLSLVRKLRTTGAWGPRDIYAPRFDPYAALPAASAERVQTLQATLPEWQALAEDCSANGQRRVARHVATEAQPHCLQRRARGSGSAAAAFELGGEGRADLEIEALRCPCGNAVGGGDSAAPT